MEEKKLRKTLYLPVWVVDLLDCEGKLAGGPGDIAGAAIMAFCDCPPEIKADILMCYSNREIKSAYKLNNNDKAISDDGHKFLENYQNARKIKRVEGGQSVG